MTVLLLKSKMDGLLTNSSLSSASKCVLESFKCAITDRSILARKSALSEPVLSNSLIHSCKCTTYNSTESNSSEALAMCKWNSQLVVSRTPWWLVSAWAYFGAAPWGSLLGRAPWLLEASTLKPPKTKQTNTELTYGCMSQQPPIRRSTSASKCRRGFVASTKTQIVNEWRSFCWRVKWMGC